MFLQTYQITKEQGMKFSGEFARTEYTDSVGNILEVHETIDGVDLGIQGEHVHIEAEDAVGIAQAILNTRAVDAVIVPGKLPEVIFSTEGNEWEHKVIIKDSFPLRYWGLCHVDPAFMRDQALEMLAFADAIEDHLNSEEQAAKALQERRDKAAQKITPEAGYPVRYADFDKDIKAFIDEFLTLEDKLAAKEQAA